ncbi:procollagen C-endopeptidase enhancer 1 isoform X2 [Nilaparvata lugens]|uniref:procollagen C-endopeptidase enhancer 1 isoform X2 n=1 Tax=Nilaparvata lugens TaxID=108931 RepID=UPI00193D9E5C|nr:procollagen C-endopeptidase enhancer 1 isoform X2 [Nilaparvata lugens]
MKLLASIVLLVASLMAFSVTEIYGEQRTYPHPNYGPGQQACGGILKSLSGTIQSPQSANEQGKYPHNMYCVWEVAAPAGYVIQLTWSHFSLEETRNCALDYVVVSDNSSADGSSANILGRYCGRSLPPQMISKDNFMKVIFISDVTVAREGFSANYIMKNVTMNSKPQLMVSQGLRPRRQTDGLPELPDYELGRERRETRVDGHPEIPNSESSLPRKELRIEKLSWSRQPHIVPRLKRQSNIPAPPPIPEVDDGSPL